MATSEPMSTESLPLTGTVIQNLRKEGQVSIAIDWKDLPAYWGERLRVESNGVSAEVLYHGPMKAWSIFQRIFGQAARAKIDADPGIDAYLESALTMGGNKVPDHDSWVRLRASLEGGNGEHPLFDLAPGTTITISRTAEPVIPEKPKNSKAKDGTIQALVLASHPHGLMLKVDLPLLRKLPVPPSGWYELEINGRTIPVRAGRRLSPEEEQEVWQRPHALLYDYESHWVYEQVTVMRLAPMQMNWRGKFPDAPSVTTESVEAGTIVTLRPGKS
jgi:hypothetical protein